MARKNLIRVNNYPYHVTIRTNNREWFNIPQSVIWKIAISSIHIANYKYPVNIDAFVLMNNHYHLLLYTPDANLDKFMNILNSNISREIRRRTGRINRIFGDRYKWKIITSEQYYLTVIKYILQNPLRALLVKKCEEYRYSTIFYQINNIAIGIRLPPSFISDEFLAFINVPLENTKTLELKKSLNQIGFSQV